MKSTFSTLTSILIIFILTSCSSVQEYVFPSLSDEEVVAPPQIENEPSFAEEEMLPQSIPPSQYAPPPQSVIVADTGPTGTFVGGKINQFRGDLVSILTKSPLN